MLSRYVQTQWTRSVPSRIQHRPFGSVIKGTMQTTSYPIPTLDRAEELRSSLSDIQGRVSAAAQVSTHPNLQPVLVAVSKYKPAEDIFALYEAGHRDFGENYAGEVADKAKTLPADIRWHFIGHLQSNKAKLIAAIPNLVTLHTLASKKLATVIDKLIDTSQRPPLQVLLQVNTSGEDAKSGLPPLSPPDADTSSVAPASTDSSSESLLDVARHVISSCPNLRLAGLMTIGSIDASLASSSAGENEDFEILKRTRDVLRCVLGREYPDEPRRWGDNSHGGELRLSMGMSSDFEAAILAGSGMVRVGSSIFGARQKKAELSSTTQAT